MPKLLTIVIPAYNAEPTIIKCLSSFDYKYANLFDVLVVDDGSKVPIIDTIKTFVDLHSNIKVVRKENGNWGSVVNYAIKNVQTTYMKVLDSDDTVVNEDFGKYLTYLQQADGHDIDAAITSFILHDAYADKCETRYYNKLSRIQYTNFDNFFSGKVLTMHMFTWKMSLLKQMKPLLINTAYTDNILIFQTILYSKKIALLPKEVKVYFYNFGDPNQSMSWSNVTKDLVKIYNIYLELLDFDFSGLSKHRSNLLVSIIKMMFYLTMIIVTMDENLYKFQRYEFMNNMIKKFSELNRRIIRWNFNTGYIAVIKNKTLPFIFGLNKIVFNVAISGFIKAFRSQYKNRKKN